MKFLISFFIAINLITFISSDSFCFSGSSKDICLSTTFDSSDKQCCYYDGTCMETSPEQILLGSNNIYKKFRREIVGFNVLMDKEYYFSAQCKNGTISWTKEELIFSSDENKIFGSNNYCLNYHKKVVNGETTIKSKETCLKAEILDSSEDLGIECGYYEITINTENYGVKKVSTCYLLNTNIMEELTDSTTIDDVTKNIFKYLILDILPINNNYSFSLNIASSDGKKANYDSQTEQISVKDFSKIIFISQFKYLLILFLL